jgi:xanthine dehydrogenase YagS FAD-binding subunit
MEPFEYLRARDPADALAKAAAPQACIVAGGTSLLDLMKLGIERPARLVDIRALPWGRIELHGGGLHIGALVRNSDLAHHPEVAARYPVLAQAILSGASPQLRNMATVGGNLLQRTRCPYFRDGISPCNKRAAGSGCAALTGHHRGHAVLGGSEACIATHPSDMCVALLALDAVVHVLPQGGGSERQIPISELHLLPNQTPARETALLPGELVVAVSVPASPRAVRSRYIKVRDRAAFEFALVSAAVAVELHGGVIASARVALGGVATKPWRAAAAEAALDKRKPTPELFQLAAAAALKDARPRRDNAFKVELAQRCIVRALTEVCAL